MAVYAVAGAKIEIGGIVATKATDHVAGDFTTALGVGTAKTVGEAETIGAIADAWEVEEFVSVTDARARQIKLFRKGKPFEVTCGADSADAGQVALRAACNAKDTFALRVTFADKITGAGTGSTRTFVVSVTDVDDDLSGKVAKVKFVMQPLSNILATVAT